MVRCLPAALVDVAPPLILLELVPGLDQEQAPVGGGQGGPENAVGRGRGQEEALPGGRFGGVRGRRNQRGLGSGSPLIKLL